MTTLKMFALCVLLFLLLIPPMPVAVLHGAKEEVQSAEEKEGLQFKLSERKEDERPAPRPVKALPPASSLAGPAMERLLKRLPPINSLAGEIKDFAFRDRPLPPPRSGKTVVGAFPASGTERISSEDPPGNLEILRFAPEGDSGLAPHLSVTFSQPMVVVGANESFDAPPISLNISPETKGRWRWIGARTLLFEPNGRFPMATDYAVEIPAGVKSAVGGTLGETKRWTFATPSLKVKSGYPNQESQPRNPLIFVEFDQRIEAETLMSHLHLRSGGREWPLRIATPGEIEAHDEVTRLVSQAVKGCWLAFRAVAAPGEDATQVLPVDTSFIVSIDAGAPSAEGARLTSEAQSFSFRTYGPLKIVASDCEWESRSAVCPPASPWIVRFNHQLTGDLDLSRVAVEPRIADLEGTVINKGYLRLLGSVLPRTTYQVKLGGSVRDVYGQTLSEDATTTFKTAARRPRLYVSGKDLVVLDPAGPRRISIYSVNHESLKVSLYAVTTRDFGNFMAALKVHSSRQERREPPMPFPEVGRRVFSDVIKVGAMPDETAETPIDLRPALSDGLGHALLVVEPVARVSATDRPEIIATWIQSTEMAIDAFVDSRGLLAWATSLKDGKPIEGAQVELVAENAASAPIASASARTGADGLVKIALPPTDTRKILIARQGRDIALLCENTYWWSNVGHWKRQTAGESLVWHVFDDRGVYRPGEEVHIKGWIRRIDEKPAGDLLLPAGAARSVSYELKDLHGNEIYKGRVPVNALGGFDTAFKLPSTVNLGITILEFEAEGAPGSVEERRYSHEFQVQEFRRPEFEVKVTSNEGPHFIGGHADLTVSANYYAGGALPDAGVEWTVVDIPASYTPPNRSDFGFGKSILWWESDDDIGGDPKRLTGRTGASGKHHLRIDFDSIKQPRPRLISADATVADVNRQHLWAKVEFIVHPSELYVGLRSSRFFVQQGEPIVIDSIVTDLDGKSIAGREIRLRVARIEMVFEKRGWHERARDQQEYFIKSAAEPVKFRFEPKVGGRYRVTASIIDDRERPNESDLTLWVAGGKGMLRHDLNKGEVQLIPNRKEYRAGETAEILIQSPFAPAEGLLTLRRSGLLTSERFTMDSTSYTLRIPIKDQYTPNIQVQVDLVGAALRTNDEGEEQPQLPKRPAFASGQLNLSIPPATRQLNVKVDPRDRVLEPGGTTSVDVEVRDAAGKPVRGSEVALAVVDEAVLALTGYQLKDPLRSFYQKRRANVSDFYLREKVLLLSTEDLIGRTERSPVTFTLDSGSSDEAIKIDTQMTRGEMYGEILAVMGVAETGIRTRINFNALAVFAPAVPTGVDGRARVRVKLPDNLTRYRVMAVAVAGARQSGSAESSITARLPLMVRPSAPRFLNFGDRFELPVVVQNQTGEPMQVDLVVRASNLEFTAGQGRRVTVPANNRIEVRFPAASVNPGTARFQVAAVSGKWSDSAEIDLPVFTPATTEAFATYGEIDAGAVIQPVKAPSDAIKQFGGLEVTTSSTQLQALTDAVLYLTSYPYQCTEQVSSRILAIAALRDVLAEFKAEGLPSPKELMAAVNSDIRRLEALQNDDGGFGFWRRGQDVAWPYLGIHAAHALQRAKSMGFDVPSTMLEKSRRYLKDIKWHIPRWSDLETRSALIAYALYVRNLMGDGDAATARQLIQDAGGAEYLPLEALGWMLPVLSGNPNLRAEVAAIRRHLNNRAEETAGAAHFTTAYKDGPHLLLHSDRRADAIILEALIGDDPKNDLIPKIVRGLLAHRKGGRWENTQENGFVLLALERYFKSYERVSPDFIARAWLGEEYAGGHEYRGRTTERHQIQIPMSYLKEKGGEQKLTLSKEGAGRMYYRIGMKYAPANLEMRPADRGFSVTRVYEAIDDEKDVRREEDGTWRIREGARVRVRLTMVAPTRRYHVALVDGLPGGFEAMNPELATTEPIPQELEEKNRQGRRWRWFEHQNLRDERVEAFTAILWEGVYNYTYVARATTPGRFMAAPAKAEEMYHPETYGRSATDRVVIE